MRTLSRIHSGGMMLSYKCNSRCRHCLYAAGPAWKDWMDVEDAAKIFQGLLLSSRHLRGFHLAGGEPFLDFNLLLQVQRIASDFRIPIEYVETNAGWCLDEETALDAMEQLRDAGLRCILISCSPFHAERVPLKRVTRAIKAARTVFGEEGVILWMPHFYPQLLNIAVDRTVLLEEYVESVGLEFANRMVRHGYSLITGGRVGYELSAFFELFAPEQFAEETCELELLDSGHAHFDPYGNFIPSFCSGISLGDARDLLALFESFDLDALPVVRTLVDSGPYGLFRFAEKEFGYKPPKAGYAGKCHLCVDVRKWIRNQTDEFQELSPAGFYQQIIPLHKSGEESNVLEEHS